MARLRIGSRGSQLALWQANHIAGRLRAEGHMVEIEIIKTTGDKVLDVALSKVGTKGMFTKELEEALAEGRIDLAVHSLKDLPTELPAGFEIAAIPERADPHDVFLSSKFTGIAGLPHGAKVGTSSLRRQAQLKAMRPDVEVLPLRGNVDTRLRKLEIGDYDAVILAAAGLKRLERTELIREVIAAEVMCPAAGQGALGIEIRSSDNTAREHLRFLDDSAARLTTSCERAVLSAMGGGCQVPIAAFAQLTGTILHLQAVVAHPTGKPILRVEASGSDADELGREAAQNLLDRGGRKILDEVHREIAPVPQQP